MGRDHIMSPDGWHTSREPKCKSARWSEGRRDSRQARRDKSTGESDQDESKKLGKLKGSASRAQKTWNEAVEGGAFRLPWQRTFSGSPRLCAPSVDTHEWAPRSEGKDRIWTLQGSPAAEWNWGRVVWRRRRRQETQVGVQVRHRGCFS